MVACGSNMYDVTSTSCDILFRISSLLKLTDLAEGGGDKSSTENFLKMALVKLFADLNKPLSNLFSLSLGLAWCTSKALV